MIRPQASATNATLVIKNSLDNQKNEKLKPDTAKPNDAA
jgi:hypothetical protein